MKHRWLNWLAGRIGCAALILLSLGLLPGCTGGSNLQALPDFDVTGWPAARPATRPDNCPGTYPAAATGVWVTPFDDDYTLPLPASTGKAGLVDFFWWSFRHGDGQVPFGESPTYASARPLSRALKETAASNPCAWRFVTLIDAAPELTHPQAQVQASQAALVRILLDDKARRQFIRQIADSLAAQSLIQGLTLNLEHGFPETAGDIERLGLAPQGSLDEKVGSVRNKLNRFVGELRVALNHQRRFLRVTVRVRTNDAPTSDYVTPFLYDYAQLAAYSDQLVLMAIDYHNLGGRPGPVAPRDWVIRDVKRALALGLPAKKLAVELATYAYDWPVQAWNHDPLQDQRSVGAPARSITPTEVKTLRQRHARGGVWQERHTPDGSLYRYRDQDGRLRDVWDAAPQLSTLQTEVQRLGVATAIWKVSASDPVGDEHVIRHALTT